MRFRHIASSLAIMAIVAAGVGTGCTATSTQESTGQYVDSTVISTKVRAQLLADDQVSIVGIDVNTYKGVVQLSGFVDSEAEKRRAEEIASNVKGVRAVYNDLVIKTGTR